ncbi:MAG: hypothetical protein ACOXZ9_07300 [Bacteroidales bacterium]|jgi:hypothetical protein
MSKDKKLRIFDILIYLSLVTIWGITIFAYQKCKLSGLEQLSAFNFFIIPIVNILISAIIIILSQNTRRMNIPWKIATDNVEKVMEKMALLIRGINLFVCLFLLIIQVILIYSTFNTNANTKWIMVSIAIIVIVLFPIFFTLWISAQDKKLK